MAVKQHSCFTIHCNHCGQGLSNGDFEPHFDHPDQANELIRDYEWTPLRDGRLYCDTTRCQLELPVCICGEDALCDADACPPGCPCLLHAEVPPLEPCPVCGETFDNHAQRQFHNFRHEDPAPADSGEVTA